jgi:hypothetical protein
MTTLQQDDLKELGIADRKLVSSFLHRYPTDLSEFTFSNLFVWSGKRKIYFAVTSGTLLFFIDSPSGPSAGKILFGPLFGSVKATKVIAAIRHLISGATRTPEQLAQPLDKAGFPMRADRDNADYLYSRHDLAELKGRRYAKKRNHIKRCLQQYQCDYEPISQTNLEECVAMQAEWCRVKGCFDEPGLEGEYQAIMNTFNYYQQLSLIGGAIRLNGSIQAFAIGERLNDSTAVWHFEKAMPNITGLGQLINQWFTKYSLYGFELVNREQDLGISGLRQAKESYYPLRLVEKWTSLPPAQSALPLYEKHKAEEKPAGSLQKDICLPEEEGYPTKK